MDLAGFLDLRIYASVALFIPFQEIWRPRLLLAVPACQKFFAPRFGLSAENVEVVASTVESPDLVTRRGCVSGAAPDTAMTQPPHCVCQQDSVQRYPES